MPELNYFTDTEYPDMDLSIVSLRLELGLSDKRQVKALRFLLCNLHSAKGRFLMVSRRKQSIDSKDLNPLQIKYPGLINCQLL